MSCGFLWKNEQTSIYKAMKFRRVGIILSADSFSLFIRDRFFRKLLVLELLDAFKAEMESFYNVSVGFKLLRPCSIIFKAAKREFNSKPTGDKCDEDDWNEVEDGWKEAGKERWNGIGDGRNGVKQKFEMVYYQR